MYLLVLRHSLEILHEHLCGFTYDNELNVCLDPTPCVEDTLFIPCRRSRGSSRCTTFTSRFLLLYCQYSICRTQDPSHSLLTGKVFNIQSECDFVADPETPERTAFSSRFLRFSAQTHQYILCPFAEASSSHPHVMDIERLSLR